LHRGIKRRDWTKLRARIEASAVTVVAEPEQADPARFIARPQRRANWVTGWRR
jgi:hypothetical protein